MARVAEFPQFIAENGRWLIVVRGVSPDIAVANTPLATLERDAQLDAALKYLEDKMAA